MTDLNKLNGVQETQQQVPLDGITKQTAEVLKSEKLPEVIDEN
jgi:hypothetical protein